MYDDATLGIILIVDDEKNITDLLKFNLTSEGYGVAVTERAADVRLDVLENLRMVIVDAMGQDYTGFDLVQDIKSNQNTSDIPVIICTASDGEETVLKAFDCGADDFVQKPFSLRELLARVRAVLRRHPMRPNSAKSRMSALKLPNLKLDIDVVNQRVIEGGNTVPLTKTEFAILVFLLKHQNNFFTREQICQEVWKDEENNNARIVDTNISRIRKKLGESGKYIINRYGKGYAFVDKLD